MPGRCARRLVVLVALACATLAPRAARADEASEKGELDARRLVAQALIKTADQKPTGNEALFAKAAEIYESAYRRFCGGSGPAGRFIPDGSVCDELAYNAARAFRAAGDRPKTIGMYRMLVVDHDRSRTSSPLAARAMHQVGAEYQALALFEHAAEWYERFATTNPKAPEAEGSLKDAFVLRLGLSQEAQAVSDAETYVKTYGATRPAEAATVMFALASYLEEREEWDRARAVLARSMSLIDHAPIDVQVQAHALFARAHAHGPTPALAQDEYAKARAFWKDPAAAEQAIRNAWPGEGEGQKDRRLAKALNAVGEAMFAAADQRRITEVEPLKFPVHAGPAEAKAIEAHLQTTVRPWLEKKRRAIEGVEGSLAKILALQPMPPPRWVIAAGATVGVMWGALADDFRRAPIPAAWRSDRVLYRAYLDAVEGMSGDIRTRNAKPAMKKCIELAAKYWVQDARTRACEVWLATNYKSEFHLVDEIVPAFRGASARPAPQPFSYEGAPLRY